MSTQEIFVGHARAPRSWGQWLTVNLLFVGLIICAAASASFYAVTHKARKLKSVVPSNSESAAKSWTISGALTEACTCAVPCTCNFGMGPSPHAYCYAFYSYDIKKGTYGDVSLDGLRFGAADLRGGRTIFIDERADARQREALRLIAMRVIEHVGVGGEEAQAREVAGDFRYTAIKQEYDDRHNRLEVAGLGEFAADYIMGLDQSQPVVVRNNTTWRVHETIKARTSLYRVQVGRDRINTKDTNSNQAEFEYTDQTDFGAPANWNCGSCKSKLSHAGKDEQMCGSTMK